MQVTGLVHDLGKLLFFFGSQGQWDVVGDTFVIGCKFSDKIIYPETFENNPDSRDPVYSTQYGVYKPHCGLDNVLLSWGHDEVSGVEPPPISFHPIPSYRFTPCLSPIHPRV
jgi:inositol oxygenase